MSTLEFNRSISVNHEYDVIVVGGGPSGCAAAASAAREGAKTLVIESTGALGGMGTSGLIPAWCPFSDKEKIIYRGLGERVFRALQSRMPHVPQSRLDWVPIDAEQLKVIYDELVISAGADVLFFTTLCGIEAKEGKVQSIIVSNKKGLTAYQANVYVDCTGDADLAAWAGAEFTQGDNKGEVQPATHCFILGNVDDYAYDYIIQEEMRDSKSEKGIPVLLMKDPELDLIVDMHFCHNRTAPRTIGFNSGHIFNMDNTDPLCVSKAMIIGRKIAEQFLDGLKKYAPEAFANAYVAQTGALMGARETRRIIGDYYLTTKDYFERRTFEDEIGRNCYFIDIHNSSDELEKVHNLTFDIHRFESYKPGESHGIPYRCLTPKNLKNVLVAGRTISTDRPVNASVRVMPVCLVTGEAAGLAAALAARQISSNVHQVDVDLLRQRLIEEGAYLL